MIIRCSRKAVFIGVIITVIIIFKRFLWFTDSPESGDELETIVIDHEELNPPDDDPQRFAFKYVRTVEQEIASEPERFRQAEKYSRLNIVDSSEMNESDTAVVVDKVVSGDVDNDKTVISDTVGVHSDSEKQSTQFEQDVMRPVTQQSSTSDKHQTVHDAVSVSDYHRSTVTNISYNLSQVTADFSKFPVVNKDFNVADGNDVNADPDVFAAAALPVDDFKQQLPTKLPQSMDSIGVTTRQNSVSGVNVVAMSLYGSDPRYTFGAVRNSQLVRENFPGWHLWIYMESPSSMKYAPVPQTVISQLVAFGAEVHYITPEDDFVPAMMWRFLVADDPAVDRFIVRDVDSRLTRRDAAAVMSWVDSGRAFHCVRDHPSHAGYAVSGGLWGGRAPELRAILRKSWAAMMRGISDAYLDDMNFLNNIIWPLVKHDAYCTDSVSCDRWPQSFPFPVRRRGYEHVGQVYDEKDYGRHLDMQILREAGENVRCVP